MPSIVSVFTSLISILTVTISLNFKSYCNYFIEEGFSGNNRVPTAPYGEYTGFTAEYENVTIEGKAYSPGFCNWVYDSRVDKIVSYKYVCANSDQDIEVSIYEGTKDCDNTAAVTKTYAPASGKDYNCGGQSCLLAMSRYNNPTNITCDTTPSNQLGKYGLVNGGCALGKEIDYMVYASCDPDDAVYVNVGVYGKSDTNCDGNPKRINSGSCPGNTDDNNKDNNVIGDLGYTLESCAGNYSMPTTTMYTTGVAPATTCTYVSMSGFIATDHCIRYDSDGESGKFYCDDVDLFWQYWNNTECTGDPFFDDGYENFTFEGDGVSSFNCDGGSQYCTVGYVHINKYYLSDGPLPTTQAECVLDAFSTPTERIPFVLNQCFPFKDGKGMKFECAANSIRMGIYNESDTCMTYLEDPNFFINNTAAKYECVVSPSCTANPTAAPSAVTYSPSGTPTGGTGCPGNAEPFSSCAAPYSSTCAAAKATCYNSGKLQTTAAIETGYECSINKCDCKPEWKKDGVVITCGSTPTPSTAPTTEAEAEDAPYTVIKYAFIIVTVAGLFM